MKIWFVDDLAGNRKAWLNSFSSELKEKHSFHTFESVESLFAVFEINSFPDILFVDYYLEHRRGSEVLAYFKNTPREQRPLLIAHSSMSDANLKMLGEGADLAFEKRTTQGVIPAIVEAIRSEKDLLEILEYKNR